MADSDAILLVDATDSNGPCAGSPRLVTRPTPSDSHGRVPYEPFADEPTWAQPAARFSQASAETLFEHGFVHPRVPALATPTRPAQSAALPVFVHRARAHQGEVQAPSRRRTCSIRWTRALVLAGITAVVVAIATALGTVALVVTGIVPPFPATCFGLGLLFLDVAALALVAAACVR